MSALPAFGLSDIERAAITGPGGTNDWVAALAAVERILAARSTPTADTQVAAMRAVADAGYARAAGEDGLRAVIKYAECHEEVSRGGECQPCEKPSVAVRLDPNEGTPYPVCAYHARADMVPLGAVLDALAASP